MPLEVAAALALPACMGYTTDFIGHIDITPTLNEAEVAYLTAFHHSRRFDRPGGPYEIPANPFAPESADWGEWGAREGGTARYNRPGPGQPELWCRWLPCWEGCCIALDGEEKIYQPTLWLAYLMEHFLVPDAEASRSGLPAFDGFTFDHQLEGMVAGCRRDNKELFLIQVRDNVVTEEILRPADRRYLDYPPLPYEEAIDRDLVRSRRRTSSAGKSTAARPGRGLRPVD